MPTRLPVRAAAVFALATLPAVLVACGSETTVPDEAPPGAGAPGGGFGGPGPEQQAKPPGSAPPQSREAFCASTGAGIVLPGTSDCTGDIASKTFRFGVCSCDPITANGQIRTRSFDSTKQQTLATGGSIGTNGNLVANDQVDIGGSVFAAGHFGVNGGGRVYEELHAGAGASANGALTVDRDYWGPTPPSATNGGSIVKGALHVPATVAPPCDCTELLPIGKIVKAFETTNDNAASGIRADALARGIGNVDLTLDCGRYYFTEISTNGKVTLRLKGRTAIFVGASIAPNGGLDVEFEGGAELDLFVASGFRLNGTAVFGDVEAPARVRVYVEGTDVSVNGAARLAGNLYAPNAVVGINGNQTTRGSIQSKGLAVNGKLDLEYDEAILKVAGCNAGSACTSCKDCNGATPACKGGKCGACETNADCCAPLVCQSGACVPSVR